MTIEQIAIIREKLEKGQIIEKAELIDIINNKSTARVEVEDESVLAERLAEAKKAKEREEEIKKIKTSNATFQSNDDITIGGYFKVNPGIYAILKRNIEKGVSTMLLGPTGIGKTELIWNIAKEMGKNVTVFDMGTMSDPIMSLVGVHTMKVRDGHTYSEFVPSRFSEAIQQPGVILLDEISRSSPAANNLLFPCLDFRRELPMEYSFGNTKPIPVHPDCVFMSTANIGSQYTGTHKIDRALMDRFTPIEVSELGRNSTAEALSIICPKLSELQSKLILDVYFSVNEANKSYNCSFTLSFRHLKTIGKMVEDGFTLFDSFVTIATGIASEAGKKEMEKIIQTLS